MASATPTRDVIRAPGGGGSTGKRSAGSRFSPAARKTAMSRLPVHLLSFNDDESEEGSDDGDHGARLDEAFARQQQQQQEEAAAPEAAATSSGGFNLSAEDLEFHSRIGEGAYGVVWRARFCPGGAGGLLGLAASSSGSGKRRRQRAPPASLREGDEVAVKVQRIPSDEQEQANLLVELNVLRSLVHPRLVRYHGAAMLSEEEARARPNWAPLLAPPAPNAGGHSSGGGSGMAVIGAEEEKGGGGGGGGMAVEGTLVLIAMEHCVRGSLRACLQQGEVKLPWALKVRVAGDVAEGLAFLHSHGLLHRDLKTTNVLLDRGWRAKICDHSYATTAASPDLGAYTCGTDEFMAPEVALSDPYDAAADVFSLGVIVCEMVTEREPGRDGFLCRRPQDLFQLQAEEVEAAVLEGCPPSLTMLGLQCAQGEAPDRPTAEEAKEWAESLLAELVGDGDGDGSEALQPQGSLSPLPWGRGVEKSAAAKAAAASAMVVEQEQQQQEDEEEAQAADVASDAAVTGAAARTSSTNNRNRRRNRRKRTHATDAAGAAAGSAAATAAPVVSAAAIKSLLQGQGQGQSKRRRRGGGAGGAASGRTGGLASTAAAPAPASASAAATAATTSGGGGAGRGRRRYRGGRKCGQRGQGGAAGSGDGKTAGGADLGQLIHDVEALQLWKPEEQGKETGTTTMTATTKG